MKKVIFVVNNGNFSGAESVNINIIENLKDKYDFYYASKKGIINSYLEEKNIKHIELEKVCVKEIKRIVKEYKPDILHATDFTASCICSLINPKNVKIISHIHCNPLWLKKRFNKNSLMYMLCGKNIDKVLTVSDSIEKEYVYSKRIKNKIVNVSNPVSCKQIKDKVNDYSKEYDLCFCGRLANEKNPLKFIDSIKVLKQKYPNIKSVMVGDGPLKNDCIEAIKANGLANNIMVAGFQKNPYVYMAKSKIFLSTSVYEGYGLVAFEAMTLGVPVAAPAVGGLVDVVDEKGGILYNEINEAITFIDRLLSNSNKLTAYSKGAIERAKEIDNIKEYMDRMEGIYSEG